MATLQLLSSLGSKSVWTPALQKGENSPKESIFLKYANGAKHKSLPRPWPQPLWEWKPSDVLQLHLLLKNMQLYMKEEENKAAKAFL